VQSKILCSALAASLVAFAAMPAVADDAGMRAAAQVSVRALPDERDGQLGLLALVGPAAAISVLTILGLTITVRGLREDMRKRRVVYRQRGRAYAGNLVTRTTTDTNRGMANAIE
jgi:hypothetical protein